MIELAPGQAEQYLSALWVRLPKNFQLLQSINEGFSVSGIQTSGRMVGYWPTDAFQRFDDDDILRLRPTEYGAITGTEELGPGFGSDGAVWVAESGTIRYVAGLYSNNELTFAYTVSPAGLMPFTYSYESEHQGWASKDGAFFIGELRYSIDQNGYYNSSAPGRYGFVSIDPFLNLFEYMLTAFGNDHPYPRFELYAGEKPPSRFDADPGQEPLSTADIHITQRTGPNVGAINLVPPISVVVQDDPIDAMWARVVGTNDEVVMVVPVYVRDDSAMYFEFGGGIELDARRAQPGDTLRLSTLQFTQPRGELGLPARAGFVAPKFSASETAESVTLLMRRSGSAPASVRATTEDGAAAAGVNYVVHDETVSWPEFDTGLKPVTVELIPIDLVELSWSEAAGSLPQFPDVGEGDEEFGTDDFGNDLITMTWSDGARRCATHETSELTWEDEGRPFQINVKINARGAKLFLGVGGAHVAPTGIRIEDGASYAWGASTPIDADFEPSIVTFQIRVASYLDGGATNHKIQRKMAVNGLWVSSSGVSLHADADDVAWSDVGILSATTFVLCVAGETDADHGTIEILHWQGSEKPLTFKVKLSDPNPPTLLDGDGVIDEATVTIFQNRLIDIVPVDDGGDGDDCLKWFGDTLGIPGDALTVTNSDQIYSDYLTFSGASYFEFTSTSDVGLECGTAPTAYIDGVYRFVDGSSWKLSFGSSAYTVAMPEDAHLGLLFDGAGGVKFAVNGQWVNPDSGSLVSDPNAISFYDITGGGAGDTFFFDQYAAGSTMFIAATDQLYRPDGVDAYELTHFCTQEEDGTDGAAIGFDPSSYYVPVGESSIVLMATRTGASDTSCSANYATADGTATESEDYVSSSGTVSFSAGEVAKPITIDIKSTATTGRDFTVQLSSPVGAILSNSSATVSIGNYFRFVEGDTSGAAISDDGYTITPVGGGAGLGSTRYVISEDISLIPAGAYYFEVAWNTGDGSDKFNFTVSPTDASGQAISIYVDIAGFGDGTNTYLDLVGEHTAYSVFPEALSTSQNVRFGFVLDYDALVAKVGLAANGHMHWVAIESGTVSFTDEYSSATALTWLAASDPLISEIQVGPSSATDPIDSACTVSIVPYADDQLYRPAGCSAPYDGSKELL